MILTPTTKQFFVGDNLTTGAVDRTALVPDALEQLQAVAALMAQQEAKRLSPSPIAATYWTGSKLKEALDEYERLSNGGMSGVPPPNFDTAKARPAGVDQADKFATLIGFLVKHEVSVAMASHRSDDYRSAILLMQTLFDAGDRASATAVCKAMAEKAGKDGQ